MGSFFWTGNVLKGRLHLLGRFWWMESRIDNGKKLHSQHAHCFQKAANVAALKMVSLNTQNMMVISGAWWQRMPSKHDCLEHSPVSPSSARFCHVPGDVVTHRPWPENTMSVPALQQSFFFLVLCISEASGKILLNISVNISYSHPTTDVLPSPCVHTFLCCSCLLCCFSWEISEDFHVAWLLVLA